jgi:hypothetical protein
MEGLEGRTMLAGHITAVVNARGYLNITGDAQGNEFTITKSGVTGNQIKITGQNGTTINKKRVAEVTLRGFTQSVRMNTGGGDDVVNVDNSTLPGGLSIETGDGDDQVFINTVNTTGRLFVSTGAGDDLLNTREGQVDITTEIHMGAGNDVVDLSGTAFTFRFFAGLGAGDDLFLPGDSTFKREQRFVDGQGGVDRIVGENDEDVERFGFNFADGSRGWNGGISDFLRKDQDNLERKAEIRTLDSGLGTGTGFYLSAKNLSDDVFHYIKRQVSGLKRRTDYRVRFEVTFGSNTPSGSLAIGGLPGDEVFLKVGGSTNQPMSFIDKRGRVRFNLDKGATNAGGRQMTLVSTTANGNAPGTSGPQGQAVYKSVTKTAYHDALIRSDRRGRLWLAVGFDSMFNGTTAIYIQSINVMLLPQT